MSELRHLGVVIVRQQPGVRQLPLEFQALVGRPANPVEPGVLTT
jgi:hypothetical protein